MLDRMFWPESAPIARHDVTARTVLAIGPPGLALANLCDDLAPLVGRSHISTGRLVSAAIESDTPVGRAARRFVAQGFHVPDRLVVRLVGEAMRALDDRDALPSGFLISGAPRSIRQAQALEATTARAPVELVLALTAPDAVVRTYLNGTCRSPREHIRAQRQLSQYRVLTRPAVAWVSRRRPAVLIDARQPFAEIRDLFLEAVREHDLVGEGMRG
jgi:adenylate kinase